MQMPGSFRFLSIRSAAVRDQGLRPCLGGFTLCGLGWGFQLTLGGRRLLRTHDDEADLAAAQVVHRAEIRVEEPNILSPVSGWPAKDFASLGEGSA